MKDISVFLLSTIKHLFTSVIGWTLNIISFATLWVSVTFQSLPIWLWIAVVVVNVFIAMFFAWRGEKIRADTLASELQAIKDSSPTFTVSIGDVKRYTIQSVIDASESELVSLEREAEDAKKPVKISLPTSPQTGAFSSVFAALRRAQESMPSAMHTLGIESNEEKLRRLKQYHRELLQHESKLNNLYQVRLSVESTRHDKNIEIEITSKDTLEMIVEDDYETGDFPTTTPPSRDFVTALGDYRSGLASLPDKYYLKSDASNNRAVSELAYLHAAKPMEAFDSTFYVRSKTNKVELRVKIHSTKLSQPQELTVQLDLTDTPLLHIQNIEDT